MLEQFNPTVIKLIIGLGNPDEKYQNTYHNVGRLFVNCLKSQNNHQLSCRLINSTVYMNNSGSFISAVLKKFKIKPEETLIVHDDSDIELGKYKISFSRNSAGHKGIESVIKILGTKNFWRLRIGIRKKLPLPRRLKAGSPAENRRLKAGVFVLKKITPPDRKIFNQVFEEIRQKYFS